MQSHYIKYHRSSLHYRQFGSGDKLLFCFHGYGRDSFTFSFLEKKLGTTFTIIAIDLPFHGLTDWNDDLCFEPDYLIQFMLEIRNSIQKDDVKFTLLGFSMGGRIALFLSQMLAGRIDRIILLAPDGLSFNFWRWLASETWVGRRLLHYSIHHSGWLMWVLHKAEKWGLISRSLADFIQYYIHDENQRKTLYKRWISMRKFSPSVSKIRRLVKQHHIPLRMLFGAFDKVISPEGGQKFIQGIEQLAHIEILQAGHNLLSEVNAGRIAKLLTD